MDIKLIPHVGMKEIPGKPPLEQTLAQDQVILDGVRVGYAPHQVGAPLLLLGDLPESTVMAIKMMLDNRDNTTCDERKVVTPPPIGDEEIYEDEDDEE